MDSSDFFERGQDRGLLNIVSLKKGFDFRAFVAEHAQEKMFRADKLVFK
jgi:hypothetical protein